MRMGSYELLEQIGQGGMGVVYRGRHDETGQIVAVKVMTAESLREPVLLKRFAQECSAANRLRHPHIVRGLDFGFEGDQPYLVMEFVEGQSLGQRIRQDGPLAETEAVRLALQLADALHLAHRTKLIHRDVKPDNILLTKNGSAMLTDLGLIKDLDSGESLTRPRAALGTIMFTPPEQFENAQQADARSDVYGLGATLFYMLTGIAPFQARGSLTLLQKKLRNDFLPPRRFVPSLSERVDRAVCLAIDASPDRRPGSCREFAELLSGMRLGSEGGGRKPPTTTIEPPLVERRQAVRYPASRMASFQVVKGEKRPGRAEVSDISLTGLCLQMYRRCEQHTILSLELFDEESDQTITLLVRVNWVRKGADGRWSVGCSFSRSLSDEELSILLGNVLPTVVVEPRDWDAPTEVLPAEPMPVCRKAQ